ncbi:MAG: ABC transporter ATP-binding protein [Deltaproteobacteria bacterium]|nr:ABC transporter ATP-binding protein [Deltaproteobacteria bacterium]
MPDRVVNNTEKSEILSIEHLSKKFGGLKAVSDLTLTLHQGELKGLIGPNGAGKSTVFNLISGLYKPNSGRILLNGENITGKRPNVIAQKGLARTFQAVKLLEGKSVLETMMTAFFLSYEYNVLHAIFQTKRYNEQEKALKEKAVYFLAKLGIDNIKEEISNELPYGLQRKVSIATTLCLNPKVLLLDEPMAGLTHSEKNDLIDMILRLKEEFDLSIILVEHDMKVIMSLCDSIAVMNNGLLIAEGMSEEIRTNRNVIEAYLGKNTV